MLIVNRYDLLRIFSVRLGGRFVGRDVCSTSPAPRDLREEANSAIAEPAATKPLDPQRE